MNNVIFNIWMAVSILILSYIAWDALESFNNKQLAKVNIFLTLGATAICVAHLRTLLKDNSILYKKGEDIDKKVNRILGDHPN